MLRDGLRPRRWSGGKDRQRTGGATLDADRVCAVDVQPVRREIAWMAAHNLFSHVLGSHFKLPVFQLLGSRSKLEVN
jgi:hypothetical protein